MKITMITEDNSITVNGDQLTIPVAAELGEWAVQFDGENAEVEYTDNRPNEVIDAATFYARYQTDIDAHAAERLALNDAAELASIVTPEQALENQRVQLQRDRDSSLLGITHTLEDGAVVQVRPEDLANFNLAIAEGLTEDWVMDNNSVRELTVEEMQESMLSGIAQGKVIWKTYTDGLKNL